MALSFDIQYLDAPTGAKIATYHLPTDKKPKAVVHITHGMSEHCMRYERFANALAAQGYAVCGHDHRGHGKTEARDAPLGTFAKSDGWNAVLSDIHAVNAMIRENHGETPIVLFGHSMGAITGLNYCIRHSDTIAGAALWNSGVDGGVLLKVYGFLLAVERMFKGSDVPSQIARKLTFETWNKKFAPNRTESDWLSKDTKEVDKYINDPLCGFDASNGLWTDLLIGIRAGADDRELDKIRKDLPLHLLAGSKDPCTDDGKAVQRLAARLENSGITDLTTTVHQDNRHEALNEVNRDEITDDFVQWLDHRFQ